MEPWALLPVACTACSLAMFATGLSDLRQMVMTRSVEHIQFLPFLTTDVNNLSWLSYGCLKQDWTLIAVNTVGATLQTLYILVYFYFSPEKRRVLLWSLALLGLLVLGYCYFSLLVLDLDTRLTRLGLFCSTFTISMYLSPLADLVRGQRGVGAGHRALGLAQGAAEQPRTKRLLHSGVKPRPPCAGCSPRVPTGQDHPDQVDPVPVLPPDRGHFPGFHQLDVVRPPAARPLHHGPQCAWDCHQPAAVLAVLAVPPKSGQAIQIPAGLRRGRANGLGTDGAVLSP